MDRIVEPIAKNLPDGILPKEISIKIDTTGRDQQCQLWVGVYKMGPLRPAELLNNKNIDETLRQASEVGISEHDHVMLTDLAANSPHILLFSKSFFETGFSDAVIENLSQRIEALKIKSVGFYISPALFGLDRALDITANTVSFLCKKQSFDSIYLLKGDFDYNLILNLSLQLKTSLDSRSLILSLYH